MASVFKAFSNGISLTWNRFGSFALVGLLFFISLIVMYAPDIALLFVDDTALEIVLSILSLLVMIPAGIALACLMVWTLSISLTHLRDSQVPFTFAKAGWVILFLLLVSAAGFIAGAIIAIVAMISALIVGMLMYTGNLLVLFVIGLLSSVLLIGFVVAYLYFYLRLTGFVSPLIADEGLNPFAAIGTSWKLSHGRVIKLFGLMVMMGLLNAFGFLMFGVGLVFTMPASYSILADFYEQVRLEKV